MRLFTVAERELRAAARHRGLHHLRWSAAAAALGFLIWLAWVFNVNQNKNAVPEVFRVFAVALYVYGLFVGAAATADVLSRERREGTLGLLFLTNLNSVEIVAGKLCAHGLALIYSLLAIFPVMALPLMMGGITLGEFWRTVLALLNGLCFAVAIGFAASSVCVRQFPAVALATGLTLCLGAGLLGLAEGLRELKVSREITDWIATFCPLQTLLSANGGQRLTGPTRFWFSLPAGAAMSLSLLLLVAWWLNRSWRDRPKNAPRWRSLSLPRRLSQSGGAARVALRRRLLEINPFFWLAGRQRISALILMLLVIIIVLLTVGITASFFGRVMGGGTANPMIGHLIAWFWAGLAIHALVLYYAANTASQQLAEDKQIGALELLLCLPGTEQRMSRGLWLAYGRRMFGPALIAGLVHVYFIWLVLSLMVLDPPGKLPRGATPWQILWSSIFGLPLQGQWLDWQFGMILRTLVLALAVLVANWVMLGWLGRWLGLRMKHPGFAPIVAVALAFVPPTLLFSLLCYVGAEINFFRMPERQAIPMMIWVAAGIALGNCLLLSGWAATHLRHDFRRAVTSRFEPPLPGAWWRFARRVVLRFAIAATSLLLFLGLLGATFYGYQNWRSTRDWAVFLKQLKQRNETLDLAKVLAAPVASDENFAQAPAFRYFLQPATNGVVAALLRDSRQAAGIDPNSGTGIALHAEWLHQQYSKLDGYVTWVDRKFILGSTQDRQRLGTVIYEGLKPLEPALRDVAATLHLPHFQATTNRTVQTIHDWNRPELLALEQLHFLLQLRATALIALDRGPEAATDVQAGLRLAEFARQSPDAKSALRLQAMLLRSLQPIWEGLAKHQWNEAEITAIHSALARFDLLSHQTNTMRRAALAYLNTWGEIPSAPSAPRSIPQGNGTYVYRKEWAWQPKAWWYHNCIQLHEAVEKAIARVDIAAGRVSNEYNWSELNGLPLDPITSQLFQQGPWWGNNGIHVSLSQSAVNQAVIACTLERYRLARGTYPDSLDQLVPGFLVEIPRDTSRGKPMFYEPPEGALPYVLRSGGYDERIQAGSAASDDWVWSFTPLTNRVQTVKSR